MAMSLQTAELQSTLQMLVAASDLCEFCVESSVMLHLCCRSVLEQAGVPSPAPLDAVVCCKNAW